jgi:hypothetical protein
MWQASEVIRKKLILNDFFFSRGDVQRIKLLGFCILTKFFDEAALLI